MRNITIFFTLFDGSIVEKSMFTPFDYEVGRSCNSIDLRVLGEITQVDVVDPYSELVLHVKQVGVISENDAKFFEEHSPFGFSL